MTAKEFEQMLMEVLLDEADNVEGIASVTTFDEDGLMTRDRGLVIEMEDDSTFQMTIVKVS